MSLDRLLPLQLPRPVLLAAAGATDVGRVSDHDDDTTLVREDLHLYLAADGAGGHAAGNVASALAAASVAEFLDLTASVAATRPEIDAFGFHRDARRLATAIQHANRKVMKASEEDIALKGMGTTVVALLFAPDRGIVHLAHVGDSRCYRLRTGVLELLTFDNSLRHDILELRPDIDDDALGRMPPNVLTRALGMEDDVRVSVRTHAVQPGDRYLLCSDGLTDAIDPERIAELLSARERPAAIVASLIAAANNAGGPDNISSVVVECEQADGGSGGTLLPLPRPRRKVRPQAKLTIVDEPDDSMPDLEIAVDDDEPAVVLPEEPPDLVWDADEAADDAPEVQFVVEELFAANTRLGAAIDRAANVATGETGEAVRCVSCTAAIDPEANFCGFCGARQHPD